MDYIRSCKRSGNEAAMKRGLLRGRAVPLRCRANLQADSSNNVYVHTDRGDRGHSLKGRNGPLFAPAIQQEANSPADARPQILCEQVGIAPRHFQRGMSFFADGTHFPPRRRAKVGENPRKLLIARL